MVDPAVMFSPISRIEGLERLDLIDWDEVHNSVQAILQDLDRSVRQAHSQVKICEGSNHSGAWSLFTYRVYGPAEGSLVDPVVVGITFSPTQAGVIIRADMAGEEGGDILLELPPRKAIGKLAIQETARDLAERLVKEGLRIGRALQDAGREV